METIRQGGENERWKRKTCEVTVNTSSLPRVDLERVLNSSVFLKAKKTPQDSDLCAYVHSLLHDQVLQVDVWDGSVHTCFQAVATAEVPQTASVHAPPRHRTQPPVSLHSSALGSSLPAFCKSKIQKIPNKSIKF